MFIELIEMVDSGMSFLTAFNNQIDNMLGDLIMVFPDEKEFGWVRDGIAMVRKTNPRLILIEFGKIILPYKQQIIDREETFFIGKDYNDDFDSVSSEYVNKMTLKIKGLWAQEMSVVNQEKLWEYFQSLVTLAELANK